MSALDHCATPILPLPDHEAFRQNSNSVLFPKPVSNETIKQSCVKRPMKGAQNIWEHGKHPGNFSCFSIVIYRYFMQTVCCRTFTTSL